MTNKGKIYVKLAFGQKERVRKLRLKGPYQTDELDLITLDLELSQGYYFKMRVL